MLLSIQAMHNSSLFITLALTECVLLGYSGEEQLTTSIPAIPRQCNQCTDPTSVVLMKYTFSLMLDSVVVVRGCTSSFPFGLHEKVRCFLTFFRIGICQVSVPEPLSGLIGGAVLRAGGGKLWGS